MTLLDMVQGLAATDMRFVIIGGVAASAHGSARITDDLDICYDPEPENCERLAATLASWNAYPRGVEPGLPFIMDARTLHLTPVLTLITNRGRLDVMDRVAGVGDFGALWEESRDIELAGRRVRVLDLAALIKAKRAAGRTKDRDQLPELEALLELTRRRRR